MRHIEINKKDLQMKEVDWAGFLSKEDAKKSKLIKENKNNKYHLGHIKEDVGYSALHDWVRYHKRKTGECGICGTRESGYKDKDFDLANISGEYKRDINDFEWLCRKCHMLKDGRLNILLKFNDIKKELEKLNYENFTFDPKKYSALLLTHAHLDHCGRIPKLINSGFKGKIYATDATKELAFIVMADSAKIAVEDAEDENKRRLKENRILTTM